MIQNAATQISCIVNDHSDYVLCKSNKFKPRISTFELKPAIDQVLTIYKLQASNNRVRFQIDFDPDLPREIQMDKGRLQQVLRNIVSNSLKFTETGSIKVAIRYTNASNWLETIVKDTGRGISPEDRPKVFKEFQHFSKHSNNSSVGLGLCVSKMIATALNGNLKF